MPTTVLKRMRELPNELTWLEVVVGNQRMDPVESIRIQGVLEQACMPVHRLEELTMPYHVVGIFNYPGNPKTVTRSWAIYVSINECEIDPCVYLVKALPEELVERIVNGKPGAVGLGYDSTNYTSVMFGDIPEDEHHSQRSFERSEMLRKAEVPEDELSSVVIALDRTYLSH